MHADTDEEVNAKIARIFLPILAGLALFALASTMTGLAAFIPVALGGSMIGGAALIPFFPHDECNPPEGICRPAAASQPEAATPTLAVDTNPPPITATVDLTYPIPPPGSDLEERAAAIAAATAHAAAKALAASPPARSHASAKAGASPTGQWVERTAAPAATATRGR
jgi:hypothetical protein